MKQKLVIRMALTVALVLVAGGLISNNLISSRISARVQSELPKAKGVKAELSFVDSR